MVESPSTTKALPVIVIGAGIGGLAAAICLERRGLSVCVFEKVSALKPLGVGINLLPHAARVLHELNLASDLVEEGIQTARLSYYNKHGQLIWSEPRGIAAGYSVPQYSIHRGSLQMILYRAAVRRLGEESVVLGAEFVGVREEADAIVARFRRTSSGEHFEVRGVAVIAADGIHSVARRALYPDEGAPNFARRILWRATSEGAPFLDGRTMIMAGYQHEKFVCYPISRAHEKAGRALINWIAELTVSEESPPRQDWNREVPKEKFATRFKAWRFDWLDVPQLIETASVVYEYPLVDRDPLPTWTHGRLTLLGDAAHPMYPIGSNGASQAILDAEALANSLQRLGVAQGLAEYESIRRPATSKIVLLNRQNGPEQVMQIAEERAPQGFKHVHDVISRAELEEIASRYKQTAGFTVEQVNAQARAAAGKT